MSWKLAELRWRQEAGLKDHYDIETLNRTQVDMPDVWSSRYKDRVQSINGNDFTAAKVWSSLSWDRPRNARLDQNRSSAVFQGLSRQPGPDLDTSDYHSPHLSVSSATPLLLNVPRTRSTFSFSSVGVTHLNDQEAKLAIFPHREEPCTQVSHSSPCLSTKSSTTRDIAFGAYTANGTPRRQASPTTASPKRLSRPKKASTDSLHLKPNALNQMSLISESRPDGFVQVEVNPEHAFRQRSNEGQKGQLCTDVGHRLGDKQYPSDSLPGSSFEISDHECDRFIGQKISQPLPHHRLSNLEAEASLLEKRKSTNSSILNEARPESLRLSPCGRRRTIRPFYPDLPSAHAKILGTCGKAESPQPSSEFDLRFPLAYSVSSEEVDERENMPEPSIQDTSIPLRDLTRREVLSAQGVLHEAGYHQESSAIFETSEISEGIIQSQRESITLDEIVSQYVDRSPPRTSPHHRISYHQALRDIEDRTHNQTSDPFPGGQSCILEVACQGSLQRSQPDSPTDLPADPVSPVITAGTLQSTSINHFGQDLEAEDSTDEWPGTPHSSRCGFLTPSKMRFRLTKRDTTEAGPSSRGFGRSPVSPWDPLRRSTSKRRQERLDQADLLQRMPGGTPVLGNPNEDMIVESASSPVPRRDGTRTQKAVVPPPRIEDYPPHTDMRPLVVDEAFYSRPPAVSTAIVDVNSPSTFLANTPNSAVPSSSLLPGLSNRPLPVAESPKSGDETADSRSKRGQVTDFQSSLLEDRPSDSPHSALKGVALVATLHNGGYRNTSTKVPAQGNDRGQGPNPNQGSTFNVGSTVSKHVPSAENSLRHLWQSEASDDDGAISRLLRDSRLSEGVAITKNLGRLSEISESGMGIKAAGSSLADYSSSVTPISRRWRIGPGIHVHYRDDTRIMATGADERETRGASGPGLTMFAPPHHARLNNSGSYGTLNRVESGDGTLISSNSTSASLLSRSRYHPRSEERSRETDAGDKCPKFPLTAEQLAQEANGTGRVPFERLELLNNGEWLERGWCSVHRRNEFSHAALATRKTQDDQEEAFEGQHQAGRFLLGLGVALYFIGGFVLIHDMRQKGILSQMAMREVMREASGSREKSMGDNAGISFPVHSAEAEMARMVERAGMGAALMVLLACFAVCVWAAVVS